LPSTLARGSESRSYSHKVRMYVRVGSRSGMSRGMSLHTIGRGYICVAQSETFRYTQLRYWSRTVWWAYRGL